MSDRIKFLDAVFAASGSARFDGRDVVETHAFASFLKTGEPRAVSPLTPDGVAFVFGVQEGVEDDAYLDCKLAPAAVLYQDGVMILCWAFDEPMPAKAAKTLAEALGMEGVDEDVPLPIKGGWRLVDADPKAYHTLDALNRVYGSSAPAPQAEAPPWEDDAYGDARVLAPYDESDPVLAQPITVTLGAGRESIKWKPATMPLGAFIAKLCQHPEDKNKDGPAFVLGDMVAGRRLKTAVKALYAVGLDIDVGTPSKRIDDALLKLGCLAVRYTTHSHGKTKTDFLKDTLSRWAEKEAEGAEIDTALIRRYLTEKEQWEPALVESAEYAGTEHENRGIVVRVTHATMPKHRIVMPLAKPFVIAAEGSTQKEAMERWKKVPAALAGLLGVPFDKSCDDPSRLFYFPRHTKGAKFEATLVGGPLFDWKGLTLDDPWEAEVAALTKGTSKSTTAEGKALGRWSMKCAHGFQVVSLIEEHAPDKIRSRNGEKIELECPFDDEHSNPGDPDDRACFAVNAGDGPVDSFTLKCLHETCKPRTNLDMLGRMIVDGWFPESALEDDAYNALGVDEAPNQEVAQRIEKEDTARDEIEEAIQVLSAEDLDQDLVEEAIRAVLEANLGALKKEDALERIKARIKITAPLMKKMVKTVEIAMAKEGNSTGKIKDPQGRAVFSFQAEFNFDEAYDSCFKALLMSNRDAPVFSCIQDKPVRMTISKSGRITFEELSARGLWSELNKRICFVRRTEQGDSARGSVPREVADHVYEQAYERLPQTPEIIYTPLFTADDRLIVKPKWYPKLDLLMADTGFEVPEVFADPTQEEVYEAVDWLLGEILGDFPFLDHDTGGNERREPSEANALAMILTPFMRRLIDGCTPVFFVSKPTPGTGGTLLGKLPMLLFDGQESAPMRYTQSEEEMQKALLASIMETRSHLFFDDVKEFNNRSLLQSITSQHIGGRLLGATKTVERPNRFNWVATGNNPIVGAEMERRICWIRLNAKTADIQQRTFRHPDYEVFVRDTRSKSVHACLILIQNWINLGKPKFHARKRASFEDWSAKVGGVLMVAGVEGFLDNRRSVGADMDEAAIKQFVREWLKKWGRKAQVSPGELFSYAFDSEFDIITGNNDDQKKTRFQKTLPSLEGRTFHLGDANYMVRTAPDSEGNTTYYLEELVEEALEPA